MTGPAPATPAASVLLARSPGSPEVFLVARSPALRFMGGFHAFPGGKLDPQDAGLARPGHGLTDRHVTAVREVFEEVGILLARGDDGSWATPEPDWAEARRDILECRLPFAEFLARHNLHIDPTDLHAAGHLVTPPFAPLRFDTAFFVADCPPGQHAEVWTGELDSGFWSSADAALTRWEQADLLLSPPSVSLLQAVRGRPLAELPERAAPLFAELASGSLPPVWFAPGVLLVPLFCAGLPPTTHTNAYLVGTGPVYLLDPGPTDPAEQDRLFAAVDREARAGRPLSAVVLTHSHPDHVGAAAICSARYGVPVLAHALAAERLRGRVRVDRVLEPGDRLPLGLAPHGRGPWHLEAVFTPGHAPDHLAFHEREYGLLLAGDLVSTISSVIVAPPDGDLAVYLDSLRRARDLPTRLLLPAHGGASARPAQVLGDAITHRARREAQLLAALASGPRTVTDLVQELYRGLPSASLPLAHAQTEGGLAKLLAEGRVAREGHAWRTTG